LNIKTFQKTENGERGIFSSIFSAILFIGIVKWFFPSAIPLDWFFWGSNKPDSVLEILSSCWPVFTFGIVYTFLIKFLTSNEPESNYEAEEEFFFSTLLSIYAGVTEEIAFRWILFLACIPGIKILDWVLGGFIFGTGLSNFAYSHLLIPLADLVTFHQLSQYLYNPLSWAIGAAIITTNGKFRDGHSYQGTIGMIDAWFFGMFMYKIVWECGIVPAIIVHIVYNVMILGIVYIDKKIEFHFHKNR
jgi:hypothetical protein